MGICWTAHLLNFCSHLDGPYIRTAGLIPASPHAIEWVANSHNSRSSGFPSLVVFPSIARLYFTPGNGHSPQLKVPWPWWLRMWSIMDYHATEAGVHTYYQTKMK